MVEDENPAERTPLEWRQAIYEEKLAQARQSIVADANIQTLRRFFDAELDEDSVRPFNRCAPCAAHCTRDDYVW